MPKKKKPKPLQKTKLVKAAARARLGSPPAARPQLPDTRKPPRHRPTMGELLEGE